MEHVDVLIMGAGLSGICAAIALKRQCPRQSYAILEARDSIGGTWDLFRYPGIRSDSDMFTLGYSFKPWVGAKAIADGPSILDYINDATREFGVGGSIRFRHRIKRASWSSESARWTVDVETGLEGEPVQFTCNFLLGCSGYYDYAQGYTPSFPGSAAFAGTIIHPQKWPLGFDYADKRIIVIGSGATAVTLVPELAKSAAGVTMLQRSPTYMLSLPSHDKLANFLRRHLPARMSYRLTRWKNVLFGAGFYWLCKHRPDSTKQWLFRQIKKAVGADYDVGTHFTPRYLPWDQRVCFVPDGDLFAAIKSGKADIVTDEIETFTANGIKLRGGAELCADIIVTATGINLLLLGGIEVAVDGRCVDFSQHMIYRGAMYEGVPNLASVFGYTNASWTLRCELTCNFVCRLLNHMDQNAYQVAVPKSNDTSVKTERWLNLSSGYIERASDRLPKQGSRSPWKQPNNYVFDALGMITAGLDDGVIKYSRPAASKPEQIFASEP